MCECKILSSEKCLEDLNKYKDKQEIDNTFEIFYCSCIGTSDTDKKIIFYDKEMKKTNLKYNDNISMLDKFIHSFHNDIRKNTRLNEGDKPLFISSILLSFLFDDFKSMFENENINNNIKENIVDYIIGNIKKIDANFNFIDSFNFLKTNIDSDKLYGFCRLIYNNIIKENYKDDLLNKFYTEFVSYNNTDSKSLGIVLTPDHIVRIMTKIININQDDIILDLCSGTGSFLCESLKYNPKYIIGCETQNKLTILFKINMYLRRIKKYNIINNDCFNEEFKATKSIINPPYGVGNCAELDFVLKQLQSINDNGLAISIIPLSCLLKNNKKRNEILNKGNIKCIIKCNPMLFYPSESVHTCILLIEKNTKKGETLFIDYSDDGIIIEKHIGKKKEDEFENKLNRILDIVKDRTITNISYKKMLDNDEDWIFKKQEENFIVEKNCLLLKKKELEFQIERKTLQDNSINKPEYISFNNLREFKIGDIFILKKGSAKKSNPNGNYALIGASKNNNGIIKYINTFQFENQLTISTNGSVGESFYHPYKFNATADICVLTPKNIFSKFNIETAIYISEIFKQIGKNYSYGYKFNMSRIKEEIIKLPINNEGKIDILL